jgi:hypothetical protein
VISSSVEEKGRKKRVTTLRILHKMKKLCFLWVIKMADFEKA